ncbi:unnamed protein product [Phaedon cochleariae]|uniref:Uncharacterized protein n=1 Tax=Phaedon cochleariae TaxID=80249 RepID=A0A9N9X4C2_PHACE|nr:unnamed protein product [Phaedon cochleariae]
MNSHSTSPLLIENQTILQTDRDHILLFLFNEERTNPDDLILNDNDIDLDNILPAVDIETPTMPNTSPEKYLEECSSVNKNDDNINKNNKHDDNFNNNLQMNQNAIDLENSDVNDPDYVLLPDDEEDDTEKIPTKKRRKLADRNCWDKYVNQKSGMHGKEYIGYTRKNGVVKHDSKRNQRQMGLRCESTFCKRASNRHCDVFTDDIRQLILEKFWAMDWEQKRLYIVHMTNYSEKK